MTTLHAIILALLQGATELFPVSSLGHAVVAPALLRWDLDQRDPSFLPFLVMLHLGTATALLLYFRRDWRSFALGVLGADRPDRVADNRRLFGLVVVATLPGVAVGFFLEHFFRNLFGSPSAAAAFVILNGVLLLVGERLRARSGKRSLAGFTARDALAIGCWQCTALIPGISRSGATMVGGLLRGLSHEEAARFSFLIATPIIAGATLLETPKLLRAGVPHAILANAVLAAAVAGVAAFASTAFLMRYFREHDRWALSPFAYYCLLAGFGSLTALWIV